MPTKNKILLIDDTDFILDSTSVLLEFEGYEVITALDGTKGIELAINNKPDLIICDISMPGLSGYDVLARLRSNKETATIPFVFLTALTEKSKVREGMQKGADDYLTKPFGKEELLGTINAQLKKFKNLETHVRDKVEEVGRKLNYALPHEFRTVMTHLLGSVQILHNQTDDLSKDDIKELTADMNVAVKRLSRITENFLRYTQLENFKNSPQTILALRNERTVEPMAIALDVLDNIAQKYERLVDRDFKNPISDITIAIGAELFTKLIDELVDNAFKFSSVGEKVTIKSSVETNRLKIEISDFGRGMTAEQINKAGAYTQFQREHFEQQGVGIGLEIAKSIVSLHDGTLEIISEAGRGTTIIITLPLSN